MTVDVQDLARRERQILSVVYSLGRATAAEVHERLADAPSYSTVRKILSILESKGHIKHTEENRRYVYLPTRSKERVRTSALRQLMSSLFENSAESVVSTLLDISAADLSDEELRRLAGIIDLHRKERG